MAQEKPRDIEYFKNGFQLCYHVSYLGNGPVEVLIPDYILNRNMSMPGKIYFSLEGVDFKVNWNLEEEIEDEVEEDEEDEEYLLSFSIDEIEDEKACQENKILSITLLPCDGNSEERRYYFDVSEDGERKRAVYHPQWINFGKRYNERHRE